MRRRIKGRTRIYKIKLILKRLSLLLSISYLNNKKNKIIILISINIYSSTIHPNLTINSIVKITVVKIFMFDKDN